MILLLTVAIVVSYLAVVSWIAGFLIAKYGGGGIEGVQGRVRSIMIPIGRHRLHLHHWLICSGVIIIGMVRNFHLFLPQEIFFGLLGGSVFQGIYCYKDWRKIVLRKHSPPKSQSAEGC
ncbi:MAG: hypothetical protein DDT24_00079 [Chloroflexi bacterium]|nr:hypothetical protein [Chloroflexota bacterium]